MAILDANTAAALSAILVIYIGITVEKYYVSWSSVYTNTLSLFVTLAALDLEMSVLILLLIYTILGYIAVKIPYKEWVFISIDKLVKINNKYRLDKNEIINGMKLDEVLSELGIKRGLETYLKSDK